MPQNPAPPAAAGSARSAPPWDDPDFVDVVFEYLLAEFPQIAGPDFARVKTAVRDTFANERVYIRSRNRSTTAADVLALFNGRNAREVARSLNISRASVYRYLKQAGK